MRGVWGTGVGGAAVAVLAIGSAGCWRQPGFGPLRQGWNRVEDELTVDNVARLDEEWVIELDDGRVRADPVISGRGLLHVSDDQAVYGLDFATGARRWRRDIVPDDEPATVHPGPVSADETSLHVPWGGAPDTGWIEHLDAATGEPVDRGRNGIGTRSVTLRDPWQVDVYSGFIEGTVAGVGIIVTGPTRWGLNLAFEPGPEIPPPTAAAVTADRVFVGLQRSWFGTNLLAGWDLTAGCPFGTPVECVPAVQTQLDGPMTEAVVADGEATVFVATATGTVYAVDPATGAVRWTAALDAPVSQRPAWTPEALFVVTDAGDLVALDPDGCGRPECRPSWTADLAGPPTAPPAVAGGVVYVATEGGAMEARAASGRHRRSPLWRTDLDAEITGGPTVAHGRLFVGTADGHVVAFSPTEP